MILKIEHEYQLPIVKKINKDLEFDLEEIKKELESYFKKWNYVNFEDIVDWFKDKIEWNNFDKCFENEYDYNNYIEDFSDIYISNLDEIINKHFLYLIKENTNNCCKNQTGNYCSICGTKLK